MAIMSSFCLFADGKSTEYFVCAPECKKKREKDKRENMHNWIEILTEPDTQRVWRQSTRVRKERQRSEGLIKSERERQGSKTGMIDLGAARRAAARQAQTWKRKIRVPSQMQSGRKMQEERMRRRERGREEEQWGDMETYWEFVLVEAEYNNITHIALSFQLLPTIKWRPNRSVREDGGGCRWAGIKQRWEDKVLIKECFPISVGICL